MKKVITITICICLVFSSITPAYAANNAVYEFMDNISGQGGRIGAYTAIQTIISYLTLLTNQGISTQNFLTLDGYGNAPQTYRSFQDLALILDVIGTEFLYAQDVNPNHYSMVTWLYATCDKIVGDIYTDIAATESTVSSIASYLFNDQDYYLSGTLSSLNNLNNYNLQKYPQFNYYLYNRDIRTSHWQIDEQGNFGEYTQEYLQYNSSQHTSIFDYIVAFLSDINYNQAIQYNQLMTDVDATLSIWDSQGDSLTQSTWTPSSAMNGLYKYLAYTQRDVARLTHVLASDYEIEARDNVQDLQETFNDEFLDPSSDGAISTNDVEDISGLSGGIKENISTNANASGIFDIFNSDHGGWFSQETANELDTSTPQNRGDKNADTTYPTPLLDERINEIYNALGVNDND